MFAPLNLLVLGCRLKIDVRLTSTVVVALNRLKRRKNVSVVEVKAYKPLCVPG